MAMKKKYNDRYAAYVKQLDERLEKECALRFAPGSLVGKAAHYSLMAGGKRVRGVLVLAFCDLLGGNPQTAESFGAAIEMLHCYSLIHDDLPCMDDADTRRGQASCHKKFSEATALLAGDALLTAAFEVLLQNTAPAERQVEACRCLSAAAGGRGMVYGQELDLAFEHKKPTEKDLIQIHNHKTGDLIHAAGLLGVYSAVHTQRDLAEVSAYTRTIGLVFQIVDDLLDCTASAKELGKPIGSDAAAGKVTFATIDGIEKASLRAVRLTEEACGRLQEAYGEKADFLVAFARSLVDRKK